MTLKQNGYMKNQEGLYFCFGSRNSGLLDDDTRGCAITCKQDQDDLIELLQEINNDLIDHWFQSHNSMCKRISFEESGFCQKSIISILVTIVKNDL